MADLVLDVILIVLLLAMARGALHTPRTGPGIALFAGFGLILALIWARLGAPDLALAEAAIGAGLTSALLLRAASISTREYAPLAFRGQLLGGAFVSVIFLWLLLSGLPLLDPGSTGDTDRLPGLVQSRLAQSGVSHPVTAVLLNFRAWDTLMELLVLLLALIGYREVSRQNRHPFDADRHPAPWPLLQAWSRILAPPLTVTGGYLLWRGSSAPGGAFQAGAVLAAGLVLLRLSGQLPPFRWSQWPVRLSALAGVGLFLGIAAYGAVSGDGWLSYPAGASGLMIILIESAATVSIAVTLGLLVAGEEEDIAQ